MKPNIGLSDKKLDQITTVLSAVLANAMTLYVKTRKFHWNVSGDSFMELHKLFQAQYTQMEESIDEIAERINKLGRPAIGTMSEFMKLSSIKEYPGKYPTSQDMIKELLTDHETLIISLRKNIEECDEKFGDAGTTDFLTNLLQQHETTAWTLRRYFK